MTSRIAPGTCTMDGCREPHYALDLCRVHYRRWKRGGDPDGQRPTRRLTDEQVIELRRRLGIPDNGPSREQREQWSREEAST